MNYSIKTIGVFERQAKRLIKKYASLKSELEELSDALEKNPQIGVPLGNNCYKVRIAVASKQKGKSGGARVITHFVLLDSTIYLLSIYDKSEKDSLSDKELTELLNYIPT